MPSSTTIGMPYVAEVAAKNNPFSIARKPITCDTAFLRVIIMRNASSTVAIAMPSVLFVMVPAISEIGVARLNAKMTSAIPISIVVGMFKSGSTSQRTLSARVSRCRIHGSSSTLSTSVSSADQ